MARAHSPIRSVLDAPATPARRGPLVAAVIALALHGAVAAAAAMTRGAPEPPDRVLAAVTEMVEVELEPPPLPPESEPEPEPIKEPPKPEPPPVVPEPPPAAPVAAEAAEVLTQEPDDEVLDFGDTIVQGDSATYAGGVTEAGGSSKQAVRDVRARAGGVEGGTGTDTIGVDRSRPATLAGGLQWDCPFPEEADDEDIDDAVVTLKVRVELDGSLAEVDVARDPGSGFGREARRCARGKRWQPARDRAGKAIASESVINVRFSR